MKTLLCDLTVGVPFVSLVQAYSHLHIVSLRPVGAEVVRAECRCSLDKQGEPCLGIGVCPDTKAESGLLCGHGFPVLAFLCIFVMWARPPLALTSGFPNGSLASALD